MNDSPGYKTYLPLIMNNPEYKVYLPLITNEPEYKVYLPLIMNQPVPQEPETHTLFLPLVLTGNPATATFRTDQVRLLSATENGAHSGSPCGDRRHIQVHIIDSNNNAGSHLRLNGVAVEVSHIKGDLHFTETITTGAQPLPTPGIAEFALHDAARVRVTMDVDGTAVISDAVVVTSHPAHIAQEQLISAGFCHTPEECQRFVAARTCQGFYSWDVVFKRSY